MNREATESVLTNWRFGQVQSERLCASILHLEGYESVDPQHPLGGPDGGKDILCHRDNELWIGAAYFPPTPSQFKEIVEKFENDVVGAKRNGALGIVFFVNQYLTLGQRSELLALTGALKAEIYHLERMRSILDAPKGCGIRLEYLRIPMTEEEQWAFWNAMNYDATRKLLDNEKRFTAIEQKLDQVLHRTIELLDRSELPPSSLASLRKLPSIEAPTASLSLGVICWIHRIVTEGMRIPETSRGRFRSVQVAIARGGKDREVNFLPPSPEEVVPLMKDFVARWISVHQSLTNSEKEIIVGYLADLHHRFLAIHPFLDANGRVARVIVDQAARELLNMSVGIELVADTKAYYTALAAADQGHIKPLAQLIMASLQ